jgi:DmsE family decaheme c-type cytochrome
VTLFLGARVDAAIPSVPGATYIGSEQCKGCHEDVFNKTEHTLHGKLLGTKISRGELQARGCEACHGPGSKHLEDPANPAFNLRFGKNSPLSAEDRGAVCLQCHAKGERMLWAGSQHDQRDVTCVTCHSVHAGSEKGQLKIVRPPTYDSRGLTLAAIQYNLCGQCHQIPASQFQRYSHMPLAFQTVRGEAGKIVCSTCHNTHGTTTVKLLRGVSINEGCTRCHADKRGPFLWEHAPVLENCLNCHIPHGSNNAALLRVKPPRLCQQCHIESRHPTNPYPQRANKVFNRACTGGCHPNIHGSNHPSGVFFTR